MVGEPRGRAASLNVSLFSASTIPEMSMQEHLKSLMQFVRLATFSHDEIMKEVMTTKILTPAEGMELLTAISNKQLWEVPGFCKTQESRELSKKSSTCIDAKNLVESKSGKIWVFSSCGSSGFREYYHKLSDCEQTSVVSVNTKKAIVIKELGFMSRSIAEGDIQPVYKFSCLIGVRKIEVYVTDVKFTKIEGQIPYGEEILFPLNLGSGAPVRLEADSSYLFTLDFFPPHPIYRIKYQAGKISDTTMNKERSSGDNMTIKFKTPLHIRKITYNVE